MPADTTRSVAAGAAIVVAASSALNIFVGFWAVCTLQRCCSIYLWGFGVYVHRREPAVGKRVNSWLPPDKQFLVTRGVACHRRVRDIEASLNAEVMVWGLGFRV